MTGEGIRVGCGCRCCNSTASSQEGARDTCKTHGSCKWGKSQNKVGNTVFRNIQTFYNHVFFCHILLIIYYIVKIYNTMYLKVNIKILGAVGVGRVQRFHFI